MNKIQTLWPLAVAMLFFFTAVGVAYADDRSGVGTLTCTVEPSAGWRQELGCRYRSHEGASARFRGDIRRLGTDKRIEANRVLVWSVLGPSSIDPADLEGYYRSLLDERSKGYGYGLVGLGGSIALVPPSGRQQIPGNAAITVLELNLSALKV